MLWVWTILLIAFVFVIGCMAWLRSIKRRARPQEQVRVSSLTRDEGYSAKAETTASSQKFPPAAESKQAGSQPFIPSEEEPAAPQRQIRDSFKSPETLGHEPEPAYPQEPSTSETESSSEETPSMANLEDVHEIVSSSLVDVGSGSQTTEEVLTEQPEEADQESDEESTAFPIEKSSSPVSEALPTSSSEKNKTTGSRLEEHDILPPGGVIAAVEDEPRGDDELELETTKESEAVQPTSEIMQPGTVHAHPGNEPVMDRLRHESSSILEEKESSPKALLYTYRDEETGKKEDAARKTTKEEWAQTSSEVVVPEEAPLAGDLPASTEEQPCSELQEQTSPPQRPKLQKKKRKQEPKLKQRKRDTRKGPDLKQVEDRVEDARLLADLPEIPESTGSQRPRRPLRPSRYRPPSQEPLTVRQSSGTRQTFRQVRQQSFDLTVRLLFQRSGHFSVGLLPQRGTDLPEEIVIGAEGNRKTVDAVHDDWYEDIYPENLASLLVNGIVWEGRTEFEVLGYWRLSGRDLYVLATDDGLRGYTQTTRLKIGRVHVILCRNELLAQVIPLLQQAGCTSFEVLEEGLGAPQGWTVVRDVVPKQVVRIDGGPEILTILQPEPTIEIELKGGLYLQQGIWLHGFPPRICVSGDMQPGVEVFIDGKGAIAGYDNSFAVFGYDTVGEHIISIPVANTSKTYRIDKGEEDWVPWDAYSLSHENLCGPIVWSSDALETGHSVIVPSSNSVILGAKPGEIACCPRIRGLVQVGYITFQAVWAVPQDAFGCSKESTNIRLLTARQLIRISRHQLSDKEAVSVMAWCSAILNASRKGLYINMSDPHAQILWKEYKTHARALWRKLKN